MIAAPLVAQVDKSCPTTAYETPPKALTSMEPFKEAVRFQKYVGWVVLKLVISDAGTVSNPKIISPARLDFVKVIKDRILEWKFCPAVVFSRYKTGEMQFHIEVRP